MCTALRRAGVASSLLVLAFILAPAAAQAGSDPAGFRFSSPTYTVHASAGYAVITIERLDVWRAATAEYVAVGLGHPCGATVCTATPPGNGDVPEDFGPTQGRLDFPPGVARASFRVPLVDHHFATMAKTVSLGIFASWPIGRANPDHAVLTIVADDPSPPRDTANPLELPVAPGGGDPLRGAQFFVDPEDDPSRYAAQFPALRTIAEQPMAARFGTFSGQDVGLAVNRFLVRASVQEPGTIPLLATYKLVDSHCGGWTPTPGDVADYRQFITRFAEGIGSYRAVLFLEMDSIITVGCLSPAGVNTRLEELRWATGVLAANCPHLVVYIDAGAADALQAGRTARLLARAGVAGVQGFLLNATHFDWTSREIAYGEHVSRLIGGKHFVINTGENGRGPLVPPNPARQGNEVLCNPPGRGLGPRPSTRTRYENVDAFAWTTNPGESGGACVPGAPPTGSYWPAYGLSLVQHANFAVDARANLAAFVTHRRHARTRQAR